MVYLVNKLKKQEKTPCTQWKGKDENSNDHVNNVCKSHSLMYYQEVLRHNGDEHNIDEHAEQKRNQRDNPCNQLCSPFKPIKIVGSNQF